VEQLVFKYLSSLYFLDTNRILERGDYARVYGKELLCEVAEAFDLTHEDTTSLIESWIKKKSPLFDTNRYWHTIRGWENWHAATQGIQSMGVTAQGAKESINNLIVEINN